MLTQKDLERLWPEGPVVAYRATAERLADSAVLCTAPVPNGEGFWDLREAVEDVTAVEAERLLVIRQTAGLSTKSWLMTSRALNRVCRVALEGVRT